MATSPKNVDDVLDTLMPDDSVLQHVRSNCRMAGLPEIEVSVQQARLLEHLVALSGARRVLEIGTLGAYSTICLARGVGQGGTVVTIEYDALHANVARGNLSLAQMEDRVVLLTGAALEVLPRFSGNQPFDFVFIDADKENNAEYVDWACKLTVPGAVIMVDNVVRDGRILAADRPEKLEFAKRFASHPNLYVPTIIQTVGGKGWDGFALARKRPLPNRTIW